MQKCRIVNICKKKLFHTIKMRYEWMMLDFLVWKVNAWNSQRWNADAMRIWKYESANETKGRVEGHSKLLDLNKKIQIHIKFMYMYIYYTYIII